MNDNTPVSIKSFLSKCNSAYKTKSKEIRLSADEFTQLSVAIGEILVDNIALRNEISKKFKKDDTIIVDGGDW